MAAVVRARRRPLSLPLRSFFSASGAAACRGLASMEAASTPPQPPSSPDGPPRWLGAFRFDNRALRALPLDPSEENVPRPVAGACFSRVRPTPVANPRLVAASAPALALLGLREPRAAEEAAQAALYFSGNRLPPGAEPAAHCYCGHQFGSFAGQLGDGAAIYLGEVLNPRGERWEIQLKGAGLTPFSR